MSDKKYVVLEHLMLPDRGFRFWTINTDNNTHGGNGELWYKEILFTDSSEVAIDTCRKCDTSIIATWSELLEYHASKAKRPDKYKSI